MLKINDSVEFSRTSAAVSLVLGALCFLTASLVEPAWAPDERVYLEEIAAAPNRYQASGVLNALGSTATVFGLIGVLHLLRGRRVTLGQVGAGLVIMGSVLLGGHWLIVLVETAGAQADPDRALAMLTTASESPWGALVLVGGLASSILGPVLLAAGLWARRATPIWVPIVLLLYAALPFFASGGPPPARTSGEPRARPWPWSPRSCSAPHWSASPYASCPCPTRPGRSGNRSRMHRDADGRAPRVDAVPLTGVLPHHPTRR